jgi:branched-chain amino acid transport system ATP-binding protein
MSSPILEVQNLTAHYGDVTALRAAHLNLGEGELIAVLGPNGAGKSTLMRSIVGLTSAHGRVNFCGTPLAHDAATAARAGVVLVPEGRGIFSPMTVRENLQLGAYMIGGKGPLYDARLERVLTLFPRLKERMTQIAGSMSGGEQQMLAIGRALMADPKLLMLDEPSLGLAPKVTAEILETLAHLNKGGLSLIIVEQKAPLALKIASRVYVLANGRITAELKTADIKSHDDLAQFYFT